MACYRLTLAYDGTAYAGWQVQPGARTIQGTLEQALARIVGAAVRVTGSGRTDAGVHALGQVASFNCDTHLSPDDLCRALNACTPPDVWIRSLHVAPAGFHARRDAVAKRYRYVLQTGPQRDVFCRHLVWHLPRALDVARMRTAAADLVGCHDFRSFEAAGAPRQTSVRTIHALTLEPYRCHEIPSLAVEVEADGFLYNMVRNIVGSLVLVGRGEQPPEWLRDVLAARDRKLAGPTAPAQGLLLLHVSYA
ncbi:MAG: tRNA pseudouridine(38-40) synthase TruA [Pirellulaceae bacterium]|jgi:tRNA pseudouridine38-40 synthase|nr:tRNA pseudouridine(38-40) synthase TruA [Pirellulaceae bacterium]